MLKLERLQGGNNKDYLDPPPRYIRKLSGGKVFSRDYPKSNILQYILSTTPYINYNFAPETIRITNRKEILSVL